MQAPDRALRPLVRRRHHLPETVQADDVRHAQFAVELGRGPLFEIEVDRHQVVGAASADEAERGTWNVADLGLARGDELRESVIEDRRRVAFVAPAIEADRGVVPDAIDEIGGVLQEHRVVRWIRSVGGIGQPEILPDHDAVAIAGLEESVITDLADPVSDHREAHVAVVAHRRLVFPGAVQQVRLRKTPVATATDQPPAVDEDFQGTVLLRIGELLDAGAEGLGVGDDGVSQVSLSVGTDRRAVR